MRRSTRSSAFAASPVPARPARTLIALLLAATSAPSFAQTDPAGPPAAAAPAAVPSVSAPGTAAGAATAEAPTASSSPRAPFRYEARIGVRGTFTDNVDLTANGRSDFVTEIRPQLNASYRSGRSELRAAVSLPILLYARTGGDNDRVVPLVELRSRYEAIDNFLFVEGDVSVRREFVSPFGGQPVDIGSASRNEYTSQTYRLTPYIKGTLPGNVRYELRDSNVWTKASDTTQLVRDAYTNELLGFVELAPAPVGARAEVRRDEIRFTAQPPFIQEQVRVLGLYQFDPLFVGIVSGGYERTDFPVVDHAGSLYGLGFRWRPTERTESNGLWEHRFFGTGYRFLFNHRGALWSLNVQGNRDLSSYPQEVARLPGGGSTAALLDQMLTGRVPDPTEREAAVQEIIRAQGLPATLGGPTPIYAEQLYIAEHESVSLGTYGARNSVFGTVFRHKTRSLDEFAGVPAGLGLFTDTTQVGTSVDWAYRFAPRFTMTTTAGATRTRSNTERSFESRQWYLRWTITRALTPDTDVFAGARYVDFTSDTADDYRERAVFAGFNYRFR